MSNAAPVAPTFPDSIFRAYDIRGVVPKTLTAETAYWIGRAIGSQSLAQGEPNVSVGRDGRLSGPELVERTRHHVRHKDWGGKRYINLQAEAPAGRIKVGTTVRYVFDVR